MKPFNFYDPIYLKRGKHHMKLFPGILIAASLIWSVPHLALAGSEKEGHSHDHDKTEVAHEHQAEEAKHEHDDHAHEGEAKHEHDDHGHEHGDDHGHAHGDEPHHGGIVAVVDGIHHELVMAEDGKVSLYAEGLPEGEALNNVKARLTVLKGADKQDADLTLAEGDEHRFEAGDDLKLAAGDKVVAVIQLPEGQPRMARFEIPAAE